MPSEILRVSIFISYLRKFYGARNLLFSKVTKKFSWTYTLEFWAEIFSQYSPLKVEEHNVPSEFRSDAWFMRKLLVSTLKKTLYCLGAYIIMGLWCALGLSRRIGFTNPGLGAELSRQVGAREIAIMHLTFARCKNVALLQVALGNL